MERRRAKRRARRLQVRITDLRGGDIHLGFTTNISPTGTFVAINHIYAVGTRLRAEIVDHDRSILFECVVARSRQVPSIFRGLEHQGIGLRFLAPSELFSELIQSGAGESEAIPAQEAAAAGAGPERSEEEKTASNAPAGLHVDRASPGNTASTAPRDPPPVRPAPNLSAALTRAAAQAPRPPQPRPSEDTPAPSPRAPATASSATRPVNVARPAPQTHSGATRASPGSSIARAATNGSPPPSAFRTAASSTPLRGVPPLPVFAVTFPSFDDVRSRFTSELQYGGLFVLHPEPPPIHSNVTMKLFVAGKSEPVRLDATVVHRSLGAGQHSGFAVEFSDLSAALAGVRSLLS